MMELLWVVLAVYFVGILAAFVLAVILSEKYRWWYGARVVAAVISLASWLGVAYFLFVMIRRQNPVWGV